ncbi:DUF2993 domain-containing protein [Leifsonia sp. A12D58]|uniref:LmeA family phospholipid-binding protein n=1 Tax=Leifsonia sp. A12D58 TaxID=3397674 RepID=UPI0039E1000C
MAVKRKGLTALVVIGLTVVALIAAYFIVDAVLRNVAENRIKQEITNNLPEGVTGDVSVSIGGMSVIAQYLSGTFDKVDLSAPALSVNGADADVRIVAMDVPLDQNKTVGHVQGTVQIDQAALNTLIQTSPDAPDGEVVLGDNQISYTGEISVLGFPVGYEATATPEAAGPFVTFTPTGATITTGLGTLDASSLVQKVLGQSPISVCVAQYLPNGLEVTGVNVTPEYARVTVAANNTLKLNSESLSTVGSCG